MPNDTPFVPLSSPPASSAQPTKEVDVRGHDYAASVDDDEYVRAIAYREHMKQMANARLAILAKLKGDPAALKSLTRKTLARTKSPPSYTDEL